MLSFTPTWAGLPVAAAGIGRGQACAVPPGIDRSQTAAHVACATRHPPRNPGQNRPCGLPDPSRLRSSHFCKVTPVVSFGPPVPPGGPRQQVSGGTICLTAPRPCAKPDVIRQSLEGRKPIDKFVVTNVDTKEKHI